MVGTRRQQSRTDKAADNRGAAQEEDRMGQVKLPENGDPWY
jgi:hypothetical protein